MTQHFFSNLKCIEKKYFIMSVVSFIRDYAEVLNNLSDSFHGEVSFGDFLKETSVYLLKTLQSFLLYLGSFGWVHDFTLLPITIPQVSTAIIKEKFFLEGSSSPFLNFLEIPTFRQNSFVLGFINSLFLTLPISVIHILTIRRLYIKGLPSALFSIGGYLLGQLFFLTSVIFGLRTILTPWFSLEPFNYILGLILLFRIIYTMTQESLRQMDTWNHPQYKEFFITSFFVAWCEQTSIFQYLGNLNYGPTASLLETISFSSEIEHMFYLVGILLGCLFFTAFWGILLLQIKNLFIAYTPLYLTKFIRAINSGSIVLAIALCLSSIPFYGFDYLVTGSLGFVSQDAVFKNTVLDQYNVKDFINQLGMGTSFKTLDLDISPFDRGRYGLVEDYPLYFEDLKYRGEADWTNRMEKQSAIGDARATSIRSRFLKEQDPTERQKRQREKQIQGKTTTLPIISKYKTGLSTTRPTDSQNDPSYTSDERLQNWYTGEVKDSSEENQEKDENQALWALFQETQDLSFPVDFLVRDSISNPDVKVNLDLKIKQKYYSNIVYRSLLNAEIDLFLMRQPKEFRLHGTEELDLYTKRRLIQSYYDSLRDYSKLPYAEEFEDFFDGTKSFSNKVYNQQFKGTLRSVCRLFSLTIDPDSSTKSNQVVLKYDQPLYTLGKTQAFSAYHEELESSTPQSGTTQSLLRSTASQSNEAHRVAAQSSPEQEDSLNPLHSEKKSLVAFDTVFSGPLYTGWDETLRKFVITNKYLPRANAGYKFQFRPEFKSKIRGKVSVKNGFNLKKIFAKQGPKASTIRFTTWPLSEDILAQRKSDSLIPFTLLYDTNPVMDQDPLIEGSGLSTVPANLETRYRKTQPKKIYDNIFDYLAPKHGGFLWPGTQKPKLDFLFNRINALGIGSSGVK